MALAHAFANAKQVYSLIDIHDNKNAYVTRWAHEYREGSWTSSLP